VGEQPAREVGAPERSDASAGDRSRGVGLPASPTRRWLDVGALSRSSDMVRRLLNVWALGDAGWVAPASRGVALTVATAIHVLRINLLRRSSAGRAAR